MNKSQNTLNVRRLVGAILLTIGALSCFFTAQQYSNLAMFGKVRFYQSFLYYFAVVAAGLAIWYFVTLKKPTNQKAELIIKILVILFIGLNAIYAAMNDVPDASVMGVGLLISYFIGCPWGKQGYKKHPYPKTNGKE